ncbi:MAG: DUF2817 domain-containing protein, partial [Ignavibacteriales bacterium]|nr:DUF2817 domain-containing protein [Ignavibacteriales bacterium]
ANEDEFNLFLSYKIPYEMLPHPGDVPGVKMATNIEEIKAWDVYPTYDGYIAMMNQFQATYPQLCKIIDGGNTVQSRKILFAKISDNVEMNEAEPNVMYSSSIHGDETTGYVTMLRLIDYMLTKYGSDAQITNLVNNLQIWINPLANPDGTYRSGNSTVNGATRYNANNVDMNRNFADPADGPHPDGKAYQPEVIAMMNIAAKYRFAISGNFHGGAEVVNYPWDTWVRLHPDDAWMVSISRAFADTVHKYAPAGYLTDLNNGITNGYDWYRITGGRQDYFTYFHRGREITFEISNTKLVSPSQLPAHWNYLYRSLLDYLQCTLYGIKGVVTNTSGQPLKAKIFIQNHDVDNADILTDSSTGVFTRMIAPGTYTVVVSADSHITQTFTNIQVVNRQATTLNVLLQPVNQPAAITWQTGLNIRDNGNENGILTFGLATTATNGIDPLLGEITLPPTPPAGVFDLRFELPVTPAEYSAKDYRKDTATTANWIIKLQPGMSGYPFTITWTPSALPVGSFTLKDAITGTLVNVDMKAQNSYTLTNTGITSLIVSFKKSACSNVALATGWNIVSVPLAAADMGATVLFPLANSAVYGFNNGYVTTTTLVNGAGYWIRYPQAASASVCGNPVSVATVPVNAGWNLIGAYQNNAAVSGITSTPANIVNSVFYGYNNGYTQTATLESGKGYWVRATQAGVLNLPAASAKTGVAEMQQIPQEYGRMTVRDAEGRQQTVYLAPANDNRQYNELPPVPPAGILDIRFDNNMNVCNSTAQLNISGAEYPVEIEVAGTNVILSDVVTNGKFVQSELQAGGRITIANASVQSLSVQRSDKTVSFSLEQNYPNPFNPSTVISYTLPQNSRVKLVVYDILGNVIATLADGFEQAGNHKVAFSSSTEKPVSSGVYFYRLQAGENVMMRKMLLMK